MKRMVMFSITMLVVSSTAFAGFATSSYAGSDANEAKQAQNRDGNIGGQTRHLLGHDANEEIQAQNRDGNISGKSRNLPGSDSRTWAPIPASALTPAAQLMGGNSNTWAPKNATPKHIHVAQSIVHEAMSRLYTAMSNVNGAAMDILHPAMQNLEMAASKLNAAMSMIKPGQRNNISASALTKVNEAMSIVNQVVMDHNFINLFPASGMTGNGGGTNTPGFTGGNGGATNTPIAMTSLDVFVNGVGAPTGSMTGGGNATNNAYHNINPARSQMNPAQSNVTNSARSQMTPARERN